MLQLTDQQTEASATALGRPLSSFGVPVSTLEGGRRRCRTLWKALNTRAFHETHSSRTLFAMLACEHSEVMGPLTAG